ncbi:MAG: PQQ-dependent sugar dehydrogenase [Pseudomonadota bacterium]|nr:PQQ-dependent sugar dehydrogenase [Pseudomonadota bacterium]
MAFTLLLLLPGIKSRVPFWTGDSADDAAKFLACAYLGAALVLAIVRLRRRRVSVVSVLMVTVAAFGIGFLSFLLHKPVPEVPRSVIAATFSAAILLAVTGFALRRFHAAALILLALVVAGLGSLQIYRAYGPARLHPATLQANISTGFYTLHTVTYRDSIPATDVRGGGISLIGDQYLLATGDGRLYVFRWEKTHGAFSIDQLPYQVPLNIKEFAADANPQGYAGKPNGGDAADRLQGVQTWQFRVADVHVQEDGDTVRVFVSHHFWKRAQQCFVVRVSSMSGTRAAFLAGDPNLHWDTVFEATPCVPLRGENSVHENNPFAGMEIGGRLVPLSKTRLMLTLGDHDFTGVETKQMFAQEPNVSYGKTILIHLDDGTSEIYSLGHRNPQGLYVTPEGAIWSTEHGPQGGDELNLIVRGANYGWPLVSYGTDYGSAGWPLSHTQGRHDGFEQPVFVWIPSIGVSNLIRIEKDRFPVWKGDFVVSSLHAHSLFRIRLLDQRVVFSEPILVGERVRDIIEGHDGRLILWTDTSSIMSLTPADGTDGAVLFATTCGGCHKAIDGATHSYGPDLAGIVGSAVASAPGYGAYSPAMKGLHGKWSKDRLDGFLTSPETMVSGTTMTFRGVTDAAQRAAIIDYLATTSRF